MTVRLLQESKVALEAFLTLEALDLVLHGGNVGRQLESGTIMKMDGVIRFTFYKRDPFIFQRGAQIMKGLLEKSRK